MRGELRILSPELSLRTQYVWSPAETRNSAIGGGGGGKAQAPTKASRTRLELRIVAKYTVTPLKAVLTFSPRQLMSVIRFSPSPADIDTIEACNSRRSP